LRTERIKRKRRAWLRLKRLTIEKFGMFNDVVFDFDDHVSLFYGNNESGKTTLIDAIFCALYGYNKRIFPVWEKRYQEGFKGELILIHNGQEISLPQKGNFYKISSLSPLYFKNVFCIRAGEVIFDKNDFRKKAWTAMLINRILGMHGDLKGVIEELRKNAGINPHGEKESRTKVWKDEDALRDEISTYEDKRTKVETLINKEKEMDIRFGELNNLETRLKEAEENKKALEKARERDELIKIKEIYKKIKEKKKELNSYSHFKEEELKEWSEFSKNKEKLVNESNIYKKRSREVDVKKKELEEDIKNLMSRIMGWQSITEIIVNLEKDVKQYDDMKKKISAFKDSKKVKKAIRIIQSSCFLSALLLFAIGFIWKKEVLLGMILIILIPVILIFYLKKSYKKARELKKELDKLSIKINSFLVSLGEDWENTDIDDLKDRIEGRRREINRDEGESREKKRQAEILQNERKNIEKEIDEICENIDFIDKKIMKIKEITGFVSLEQFKEKWDEYLSIKENFRGLTKEMEGLIGSPDMNIVVDRIEALEERLRDKDKIENIPWDEEKYNRLNNEILELRNEVEKRKNEVHELRVSIGELKGGLMGIEKIDILLKLDEKKKELDNFLLEREAAEAAYFIMRDIEKEATLQVKNILEERSSELFSQITNFRYDRILVKRWDLADIMVELPSGEEKPIEWLSSGTLNQFYMAIRIALAERSLKKQKGFLLLDDPFLTFDSERISRILDILFDITEDGWQMIFFTVDRTLKNIMEMRGVKAKNLEPIAFS